MTPNSAYKIVPIEKGKDYCPRPASGGSFASSDPVIFSILCVENTAGGSSNPDKMRYVVLQTVGGHLDGDEPVSIPAQAFKPGVHYPIYLASLVDDCDGLVRFVGYQYKVCPLTL